MTMQQIANDLQEIATMLKASRSALKPAFKPTNPVACGCKAEPGEAPVNEEPPALDELLPEELRVYDLLREDWSDDTSIYALLYEPLVDAAMGYAESILESDSYWSSIMPHAEWLEAVEAFASEGLDTYVRQLEAQLGKTTADLQAQGKDAFNEQRIRTIAATETTMARTAAAVVLTDFNNTILAVREGRL